MYHVEVVYFISISCSIPRIDIDPVQIFYWMGVIFILAIIVIHD